MTITLQSIHKRKQARKTLLDQELANIKQQLIAMGALRIILFGSYAMERVRTWSDIDVICVMPSTRSGKEWMKRIYEKIERDVSCDIFAYTAEELEQILPVSRFLRNAIATGRIIYEE